MESEKIERVISIWSAYSGCVVKEKPDIEKEEIFYNDYNDKIILTEQGYDIAKDVIANTTKRDVDDFSTRIKSFNENQNNFRIQKKLKRNIKR